MRHLQVILILVRMFLNMILIIMKILMNIVLILIMIFNFMTIREDDRSGKEAKVNYGLWQEGKETTPEQ